MPTVTLKIDPASIVVVTEDYGISLAGLCNACDATGCIGGANISARYGYPHDAKRRNSGLYHNDDCPMNAVLREDGTLKGSRRNPKKKRQAKSSRKKRP